MSKKIYISLLFNISIIIVLLFVKFTLFNMSWFYEQYNVLMITGIKCLHQSGYKYICAFCLHPLWRTNSLGLSRCQAWWNQLSSRECHIVFKTLFFMCFFMFTGEINKFWKIYENIVPWTHSVIIFCRTAYIGLPKHCLSFTYIYLIKQSYYTRSGIIYHFLILISTIKLSQYIDIVGVPGGPISWLSLNM